MNYFYTLINCSTQFYTNVFKNKLLYLNTRLTMINFYHHKIKHIYSIFGIAMLCAELR